MLLAQRGRRCCCCVGSGRVGSKQLRDIPPARIKYLTVFLAVWCGLAIGSLGFKDGWGFKAWGFGDAPGPKPRVLLSVLRSWLLLHLAVPSMCPLCKWVGVWHRRRGVMGR